MSVSRPNVDVLNAVLAATPDDVQSASIKNDDDDDLKRLTSRYLSPGPDGRALFDIGYYHKIKRKAKALLGKGNTKEVVRLLRQVETWELKGGNAPDYVTPVMTSPPGVLDVIDLTKDVEVIDVENPRRHLLRQGKQIQHFCFQTLGGAPAEGSTVTYSAQYGAEATQRHAEAWQKRNATRKRNAKKKLEEKVKKLEEKVAKKAEAAKRKPKKAAKRKPKKAAKH